MKNYQKKRIQQSRITFSDQNSVHKHELLSRFKAVSYLIVLRHKINGCRCLKRLLSYY